MAEKRPSRRVDVPASLGGTGNRRRQYVHVAGPALGNFRTRRFAGEIESSAFGVPVYAPKSARILSLEWAVYEPTTDRLLPQMQRAKQHVQIRNQ